MYAWEDTDLSKKIVKYSLNILLLLLIIAGTLFLLFKDQEIKPIIKQLHHARKSYLFGAVAFMVLYVSGESVIIRYLLGNLKHGVSLIRCLMISCIGFFFSGITPGASGGQPLQVLYMSKCGVDPLVSTLVFMIVTICFKLALILLCAVFILLEPVVMFDSIGKVPLLFTYGVVGNGLFLTFLLLVVYKPSVAFSILKFGIKLGGKLHILRNPDSTLQKAVRSIRQYEKAATYVKKNTRMMINVMLITFVQRLFYFSVCFMVAKALKIDCSWTELVALQILLALAVDALPLPGAAGANESVFVILFKRIFGETAVLSGLLLNRGITYYVLLISTAAVTCFAHFYIMKTANKEVVPEQKKRRIRIFTRYTESERKNGGEK